MIPPNTDVDARRLTAGLTKRELFALNIYLVIVPGYSDVFKEADRRPVAEAAVRQADQLIEALARGR